MTMTDAPALPDAPETGMDAYVARREAVPVALGLIHPADAPAEAACLYCGRTDQTARMFCAGPEAWFCRDPFDGSCETRHRDREAQLRAAAQDASEAQDAPEQAQDEPEDEQPAEDGEDASGEPGAAQDAPEAETGGAQ